MQSTDLIKLDDTKHTTLPLGFKKININKIPSQQVENQLMLYNSRYAYYTKMVTVSAKPISKMLQ